jgi:hypothetical protein
VEKFRCERLQARFALSIPIELNESRQSDSLRSASTNEILRGMMHRPHDSSGVENG